MRNYTTQMDAAKRGIITPEMKAVAIKEYRTEEEIRDLIEGVDEEDIFEYQGTELEIMSSTHIVEIPLKAMRGNRYSAEPMMKPVKRSSFAWWNIRSTKRWPLSYMMSGRTAIIFGSAAA